MVRLLLIALLCAGTLSLAASAGSAPGPAEPPENPRVSLRLRQANLRDALNALERATGVTFSFDERLPFRSPHYDPPPSGDPAARFDFDWTDTTLRHALEELSSRYNLFLVGDGIGGFHVGRAEGPAPAPVIRPAKKARFAGLEVGVISLMWGRDGLSVNLRVEGDPLAVERFAGVGQVTARDDRGRVLANELTHPFTGRPALPGCRTVTCKLNPPHAKAQRLAWLEVELLTHTRRMPARLEVPARGTGRARDLSDSGVRLTLLPSDTPDDPRVLNARIAWPRGWTLASRWDRFRVIPIAVGESGRRYPALGIRGSASPSEVEERATYRWEFPQVAEPIARFLFDLMLRDQKASLGSVRLHDIPLPSGDDTQTWEFPSLTGVGPGEEGFPSGDPGTGLEFHVRIPGREQPRGVVFVGLERKGKDAPGETTWLRVPVAPGGAVRVTGLQPGSYRVLRLMSPRNPWMIPNGGHWTAPELTVAIPRGRVVRTPDLAWSPGLPAALGAPPAGRPAAAGPIEVTDATTTQTVGRRIVFHTNPVRSATATLSLWVRGECDPALADRLRSVRNLVAADERGRLLGRHATEIVALHRWWSSSAGLAGPFLGSNRLRWVQGEVMAWTRVETVRFEVALPAELPLKVSKGGVEFELIRSGPSDRSTDLPSSGAVSTRPETDVSATLRAPDGYKLSPLRGRATLELEMLDEKGNSVDGRGEGGGLNVGGDGTLVVLKKRFLPASARGLRLRLDVVVRSGQERVGTFFRTDVPIAPPEPLGPGDDGPRTADPVPPAGAVRPPAGHPYLANPGGALLLAVVVPRGASSGGSLSVALAPIGREQSGVVRWVDGRVDDRGRLRLEGIRPGSYRVLLRFRPDDPRVLAGGERWRGSEARVTVRAGEERVVPPLELVGR